MNIQGLQKLTLLDYPGKLACTVFTGGCNLRCPFCHNASLVLGPGPGAIPEGEVLDFLASRRGKLDGVCVTGGEPLLGRDLADFLRAVKDLGFLLKLDTNGTFPQKLATLLSAGLLDYVAIDIKNSPERYAGTVGIPDFDPAPVFESADLLMGGNVPYEFRTTVVGEFHTDADMESIARRLAGAKRYYLQAFVDSGDLICPGLHPIPPEDMRRFAEILKGSMENVELRGI